MQTFPKRLVYVLLLPLFAGNIICCNGQEKNPPVAVNDSTANRRLEEAKTIAGNFNSQAVFHFDSIHVRSFVKKYPEFTQYEGELEKFYRQRDYTYAWYDSSGLIEQAMGLHNRFEHLKQEGILSNMPYTAAFNALMDVNDSTLVYNPMNPEAELMLTSQYLSYAHRTWQGISEKESRALEWFLPRKKLDLNTLMDSLLTDSDKSFVASEPVFRMYGMLRTYLKKYQDIEAHGGWQLIKADKKSYKTGDSSATVLAIRKRLFLTGELSGDTSVALYDDSLKAAVKKFQRHNGLNETGIADAALIREMNRPVNDIIRKIIVNMERCRWIPLNPAENFLLVNIPAFKLYVYENNKVVWDMNVVTGQPVHKTVVFTGDLKYVVFSPYWNVPPGILKNEILPGIQRDPNYLRKHNMERVGNTVRQKPGPDNSLGKVKFLFPNSHNIYLHDTPSKSLFKEESRAFSHGCIRVAEPKKLAVYLLRHEPEWTSEKIDAAMNAGKEKYVTLKETVPVFIAYFTAWVDSQGELNLRPDVYKRDGRLAETLMNER